MKNFKTYFLTVLLLSFSSLIWAGGFHCDSAQSGLWSSISTWTNCNGTTPEINDYVTIKANHEVTLDVNSADLNGFGIEAGGGFKVAASATGLTLSSALGDVINFDFSLASIELAGDFTIDVVNRDVILGDVDGAFDLTVNCPDETRIEGVIGGISPLNSLLTDSDGSLDLFDDITVVDKITFNDSTTSFNSIALNADIIIIDNDLFISNGDFTLNNTDTSSSTITGVISGSDDFIKAGVGDVEIFTVNSLTGNVILNGGSITNPENAENIFPDVAVFSLASGTQGAFASDLTFIFELTAGQSIIGSGYIPDKVDRQQNVIVEISPGFSPGQLTFDSLYVDEFATLTFELNGTTAGTEYDQIVILDKIELEYDLENGSTLEVSLGFAPNVGDEFTIIDNQSGNSVGDRFMDLDEGAIINVGKFRFSISYIGGDGNDVVLTNATCQSAQDGLWSDSTTWSGCDGAIPQTTDNVYISHIVSLDTDTTIASIDGTGSFIVLAGGLSLTITDDVADFRSVQLELVGDFTLTNTNNNIFIGGIEGNSNAELLTINSNSRVWFTGNNMTTIGIGGIVTDAGGNTRISGLRELILTGDSNTVFNDNVEIGASARITLDQTGAGNIVFNDDLTRTSGSPHRIIINNDTGETQINGIVSVGELTTNGAANVVISGGAITTASGGANDGDMIFNSPVVIGADTTFTSINNGEIFFNNSLNDDGNNGTTSAVIINNPNLTEISSVGISNPIESLETDVIGVTTINADIVTLTSTIFNDVVILDNDVELSGDIVDLKSDVDNAGFELSFDTSNITEFTGIEGVLSGAGNFVKKGLGDMSFYSINTMTGNLEINSGSVINKNASNSIFPGVVEFSLADNTQAYLGGGGSGSDTFELLDGQVLKGDGQCQCILDVKSGAIIDPGFSPGSLSLGGLKMATGAILAIELDGSSSTGYDWISTSVMANLDADNSGGATLDVTLGFTPQVGDNFNLIRFGAGFPISGIFNGLPEGGTLSANGILFSISYIGGDSNDVVLTALGSSIIRVDQNTGTGGNGESWENAFNNLQDALAVAVAGVEIWVAQGTYYPDISTGPNPQDETSTFTLINGVSLYGGFAGDETELSQRNPKDNITILSGDIDGDDLDGDNNNIAEFVTDIQGNNAYHIVNGENVDTSTIVDGFTITAGSADLDFEEDSGGAMLCDISVGGPKINQVIFIGNKSLSSGGASYGCTVDVQNSSYINNQSVTSRGGAISTNGGSFTNVVFEGNQSNFDGGALSIGTQSASIKQTIFRNNNSTNGNGGALATSSGNLLLNDVLFLGNQAGIDGGGIYIDDSMAVVFTNITATGNNATVLGGGIRTEGTGSFDIRNSILWNNQDSTGTTTDSSAISSSSTVNNSYSLIQGFGTSGTSNLDEDPEFISIANPSTAPNVLGNPRLQSTSMAIDTGNNNVVTNSTDLDGRKRIFNVDVDRGAYEYFDDEMFKDGFESVVPNR
jgi:hypothetical protein